MPPTQTQASFPLHKFNHNVVSNTLVLPPRAICIHTTASFPTSNDFWEGQCPLPRPLPHWGGGHPRPTPLGVF